jgi:hypothetical protein
MARKRHGPAAVKLCCCVLLSGLFADASTGGVRADGPESAPPGPEEAKGSQPRGGAKQDENPNLPPPGRYCSGWYHWLQALQVQKEDYVLHDFRLPDEQGRLRCSKGRISLRPEDGKRGRVPERIHIPWGARSYLVEPHELISFCNEVNRGKEPRDTSTGSFLLREADWEKKASGLPKVPEEVRDYILPKPIVATILKVMPYQKDVPIKGRPILEEGYPVTINRGSKEGVRPGLRFERHGEFNTLIAYVASVEDSSSVLVASWLISSKDPIAPGVVLSTREDQGPGKGDSKDK